VSLTPVPSGHTLPSKAGLFFCTNRFCTNRQLRQSCRPGMRKHQDGEIDLLIDPDGTAQAGAGYPPKAFAKVLRG
jgi:hypothetical protein